MPDRWPKDGLTLADLYEREVLADPELRRLQANLEASTGTAEREPTPLCVPLMSFAQLEALPAPTGAGPNKTLSKVRRLVTARQRQLEMGLIKRLRAGDLVARGVRVPLTVERLKVWLPSDLWADGLVRIEWRYGYLTVNEGRGRPDTTRVLARDIRVFSRSQANAMQLRSDDPAQQRTKLGRKRGEALDRNQLDKDLTDLLAEGLIDYATPGTKLADALVAQRSKAYGRYNRRYLGDRAREHLRERRPGL